METIGKMKMQFWRDTIDDIYAKVHDVSVLAENGAFGGMNIDESSFTSSFAFKV